MRTTFGTPPPDCDTPWWIQYMTSDELGWTEPKYILDQETGALGISYPGGEVAWFGDAANPLVEVFA